ncbi:MAG: T9SS type A sorting domain-containing protein [Bacteroidales bacterium]|nr:T9SS type A sorting domain-containing protein [Bacteroidales bacterium]
MAPNRGINGLNTLYMAKTPTDWKTPTQFFNDTLVYNTSLAMQVIGCLVGIDELDLQQHMVLYPNPAYNNLTLEVVDVDVNTAQFEIYDLMGRKLEIEAKNTFGNSQFQFDVSGLKQGIYILRSKINGLTINQRFTKL